MTDTESTAQKVINVRNLEDELNTTKLKLERAEQKVEKGMKLAHSVYSPTLINGMDDIPFYNKGKNYLIGYQNPSKNKKILYHQLLPIVRWFYENDPIAGTVVNRMAE